MTTPKSIGYELGFRDGHISGHDAGYQRGKDVATWELAAGTWVDHPKDDGCEQCVTVRAVLAHALANAEKYGLHDGPLVNVIFQGEAPTS